MRKHRHAGHGRAAYAVLVGFAALLSRTSAADAILHPGTLNGTVGVNGSTVSSGGASLFGNSNGFSGSTNFSGNTFSITVEGGQTYNFLYVNEYMSNGSSFSLGTNAPTTVPLGGTATVNLVRPGGILQGHLSVTGGTIAYWFLSASSSANMPGGSSENYSSARWVNGSDVTLSMVAGSSIRVDGAAAINVVDPLTGNILCTVGLPLQSQSVALSDGGSTTVSETLTVSPTDCGASIGGTLAVNNVPGGLAPFVWDVYAGGPGWESQWVNGGNGSAYNLKGLPRGRYEVGAYAYFSSSQLSGYLSLPHNNPPYVDLGSSPVIRDFIFDGALARGGAVLTGPWSTRANVHQTSSYGKCDYNQTNGGPSCGGYCSFSTTTSQDAPTQVLTPGDWYNYADSASFYDSSSTIPTNSYLSIGYNNPALVSASAGATLTIPPRQIDTSEGQVIFDVIEPPGSPVIGISSPTVYASRYDSTAQQGFYISAYSSAQNADTPTVRLVGPPGTYDFDAYAYVQGTYTRFASSKIDLGRSVNTPPGSPVTIQLLDGAGDVLPVTLTFADVITGGDTTGSITDVGPGIPTDYIRLDYIQGKPYLGVATTATFSNGVELAITYDPVALGLTPAQEASLKLQQYVCTSQSSCSWQIINKPSSGTFSNPDLTTHTLYGATTSLSTFSMTLPKVTFVPPTDTCIGSATAPAQLNTDPGVCSATVNNTNQRAGGCSGGGGGLASCTYDAAPSETLALGAHDISIVGTANDTSTSSCTSYVDVVDREAPAISCPPPATVECAGVTTAYNALASCTDNCLSCNTSCGPGSFPLGTTTDTCNAVDTAGNKSSCTTTVTVRDTIPPALSLTASPTTLWPPNKRLVPIALNTVATDGCDPSPKVTCSVTSNEPASGDGSGHVLGAPDDAPPTSLMNGTPSQNQAPYDPNTLLAAWLASHPAPATGSWKATDDIVWEAGQLFLRANRLGTGTGRVYTITCIATDASGNSTTRSTTVTVPHDQRH